MIPRYSCRLPWSTPLNSFSAAVAAQRDSGVSLFDLTNSNPTNVDLEYPHEEIGQALGSVRSFQYEPHPAGTPSAREAISGFYEAREIYVPADRLFLTSSTSEAYSYLFKLLCDAGDEILIPLPSYPLFEYLAKLECVRTVPYWLRYDGSWHLDFETLANAITPRTRAIIVVNPNNPTGSSLSNDETVSLIELAARHNLPIIADEVFADYGLRETAGNRSLLNQSNALIFALNGLSKLAGMPQMKLGWIAVNGLEPAVSQCCSHLETILDTYLSSGTPVQAALPRLFQIGRGVCDQIRRRIRQNLLTLQCSLAGSAANVLTVDAGWSAIVQVPSTLPEDQWIMKLLNEHQVVVQPGYFYDMPGEAFLVVSLLTAPFIFDEGIRRLCLAAGEN